MIKAIMDSTRHDFVENLPQKVWYRLILGVFIQSKRHEVCISVILRVGGVCSGLWREFWNARKCGFAHLQTHWHSYFVRYLLLRTGKEHRLPQPERYLWPPSFCHIFFPHYVDWPLSGSKFPVDVVIVGEKFVCRQIRLLGNIEHTIGHWRGPKR